MGVGRADEASVQQAGQLHVIDEAAAAGEQGRVFEPLDTGAEMFCAHRLSPGSATKALRGVERRLHNAGITGAAAKIAG